MSNTEPGAHPSLSEDNGVLAMPPDAKLIYSVGASTGGVAEIRMARLRPGARIITSTIDGQGAASISEIVADLHLTGQIEVKLENIAGPLPYPDNHFDYIYARLVLHYLTKQELTNALAEIYRATSPGGKLFVVVRSTKCSAATREGSTYDDVTGLTTYPKKTLTGGNQDFRTRYFHTEASISEAVEGAGFLLEGVKAYQEVLYEDFMHTQPADYADSVIELLASKRE